MLLLFPAKAECAKAKFKHQGGACSNLLVTACHDRHLECKQHDRDKADSSPADGVGVLNNVLCVLRRVSCSALPRVLQAQAQRQGELNASHP
jgi:hypothetical protein